MMEETGFCSGIENYSMHLSRLKPGEQPHTLIDYFPKDFLMIIDESHMSIPQVRGMYAGDRARKDILVEHGFRLPSARDNRPLTFDEFDRMLNQIDLRFRDSRSIRTRSRPANRRASHPSRLVSSIHRSRSGPPRARSTICCGRSISVSARASGPLSRP